MTNAMIGEQWVLRHRHQGEIEISLTRDAVLTVVRVHTQRREQKKLKSFEGALGYVQKLVAEHQARGFRVTHRVLLSEEEERRQEEERDARMRAEGEAQLRQAGMPVGRLLSEEERLELKEWADASMEKNRARLDEEEERRQRRHRDAHRPAATWRKMASVSRDGFVAVDAGPIPAHALDAILADGTRALQVLDDRGGYMGEYDEEEDDDADADGDDDCLTVLATKPRPMVTALVLDLFWETPTRQTDPDYGAIWGDLTRVFAALPSLTRAFVVGSFSLGIDDEYEANGGHAALQELQIVARGPVLSDALSALKQGAWPALSLLGVCSGGEESEDSDSRDLVALLSSTAALPALRELRVGRLRDPLAILRAAATRSGWTSITIDSSQMGNEDEDDVVATLLALQPRFAGASIELSFLEDMSERARERLAKAWSAELGAGASVASAGRASTLSGGRFHDLFSPGAYDTYGE